MFGKNPAARTLAAQQSVINSHSQRKGNVNKRAMVRERSGTVRMYEQRDIMEEERGRGGGRGGGE